MTEPIVTLTNVPKFISVVITVFKFLLKPILKKYAPLELEHINIIDPKFTYKLDFKNKKYFLKLTYTFKNNTKYPLSLLSISYKVETWADNLLSIGNKSVFTYLDVDQACHAEIYIILPEEQAKVAKEYFTKSKDLVFKFKIENHISTGFGYNSKFFDFKPEPIDLTQITV